MQKRGNIILIFILLVALAAIVTSYLFIISGKTRSSTARQNYEKALYLAEAGMQKVIWYLNTTPAQGGYGFSWRTTGLTESLGDGEYTIRVEDWGSDEILLTSSAEVHETTRTIQQRMRFENLPHAFDYALFGGNGNLDISGNVNVSGDIFANGDISVTGGSSIADGDVYHPSGTTVSGGGTYTDGGIPDPAPEMPPIDSSSYDTEITVAEGVAAGNQTYTNLNLGGGAIYVNGDVTITGSGTITGPGTLVATGTILISGSPTGDGSPITFISKGQTAISGNTSIPNSTFYAQDSLTISGGVDIDIGSFLTKGDFDIDGDARFTGLAYCEGELDIEGNVTFTGSLVASIIDDLSGSMTINYSEQDLPDQVEGLLGEDLNLVSGSWKEL